MDYLFYFFFQNNAAMYLISDDNGGKWGQILLLFIMSIPLLLVTVYLVLSLSLGNFSMLLESNFWFVLLFFAALTFLFNRLNANYNYIYLEGKSIYVENLFYPLKEIDIEEFECITTSALPLSPTFCLHLKNGKKFRFIKRANHNRYLPLWDTQLTIQELTRHILKEKETDF